MSQETDKDAEQKAAEATESSATLLEVFARLTSGNPMFVEAKKSGKASVIGGHQPPPPDRK